MRARRRASVSSEAVTTSWPTPCWDCVAQPASRIVNAVASDAAASPPAVQRRNAAMAFVIPLSLLRRIRGHLAEHHRALLRDAPVDPGAVLDVAGQLAAGGVDVVAARLPHRRHDTSITQDFRESLHALLRRTQQPRGGERIEGNEIELARDAAAAMRLHQARELLRVLGQVVHAIEHAVLE